MHYNFSPSPASFLRALPSFSASQIQVNMAIALQRKVAPKVSFVSLNLPIRYVVTPDIFSYSAAASREMKFLCFNIFIFLSSFSVVLTEIIDLKLSRLFDRGRVMFCIPIQIQGILLSKWLDI